LNVVLLLLQNGDVLKVAEEPVETTHHVADTEHEATGNASSDQVGFFAHTVQESAGIGSNDQFRFSDRCSSTVIC
jgi:hypothetical protein